MGRVWNGGNEVTKEYLTVVYGGARIGDTIMATSAVRALNKQYGKLIYWVHGSFTKELFRLFERSDLPLIETGCLEEPRIPRDLADVIKFNEIAAKTVEKEEGELKVFNVERWARGWGETQWQQVACALGAEKVYVEPPRLKIEGLNVCNGGYVAIQLDTISKWKRMKVMKEVRYPGKVHSLGLPGEEILPGSTDCRTKDFRLTAEQLCGCQIFVGIPSALSHLNAALGKPTIQLNPNGDWPKWGGVKSYHDLCVDLVNPSKEELEEVMSKLVLKVEEKCQASTAN